MDTSLKNNFEMAILNADHENIIVLAAQHRSKENSFSFCEQLKHIKGDGLEKLMDQLVKILLEYVGNNIVDKTVATDFTNLTPEQYKSMVQLIQAGIDISLAVMHCKLISMCRIQLTQIAVLLHGIMFAISDSMDYVKNLICLYCEKLYLSGDIENSEDFLCNVVLYLVQKTLAKKANKNAVKRLYVIRNILIKVMEKFGPNGQLWSLFVDCAVSRVYLECLEGTKTIALVMSLDCYKLLDFHEKIMSHLQSTSIKNAIALGRVYFDAWQHIVKAGNNQAKDFMEVACLKKLMEMAIESKQQHILPIIQKILHIFLINKKDPEVSKMLNSVYLPTFWRYIKHPDGLCRASAAQLFLDAFPIEDPDMRIITNDIMLNDQLLLIRELLLDPYPIVRITALLGISLSMSVNWEVFPEEILKTYFRIIVNDLSRDSASPEVRVAVVKGMMCILKNPLAVKCLVNVLPKLNGLFHDTSENVRLAFCQLLLKVKKISAIKYFDVVPINHLLARIEEDSHSVRKSLTNLLHNSYFPRNEDPKIWLGRCLQIIKAERVASRIFFTYVSNFIGIDASVKFMIQAVKAVHLYVKTKCSSRIEISDKENIGSSTDYVTTLEEAVGFGNLKTVSTLMEAIAVMWLSLKPESDSVMTIDDIKKSMKMLVGRLGPRLSKLCLYYKDTEAWASVFYLSSFLPMSQVPCLASLCFARLKNLPPDAKESDYMTLLECLANQFHMLELLTLLKEWIEIGLTVNVPVPPRPAKKRRGRGKSSEGIHQEQGKPYLANRMLDSILNRRNLQKHALVERSFLQEMLYLSDNIKRKLENTRLNEAKVEFLNLLVFNIVRISVHLHTEVEDQITSVPLVNEFVEWTITKLVKHIVDVKNKPSHITKLVLGMCENLCTVLGDVTAIGFLEPILYLKFIYTLLRTGYGYKFLLLASSFLYKHAFTSEIILLGGNTIIMNNHLRYLHVILDLINNQAMLEKQSETELDEIASILACVMPIVVNQLDDLPIPSSKVVKCLIKNILDSFAIKCASIAEEMAVYPFDKLSFPMTGSFFFSIINKKPKLSQTYVKYLIVMFKEMQNIDISTWIAYWMMIWQFLSAKSTSQTVVQDLNSLMLLLQKSIRKLFPKDPEKDDVQDSSEAVQLQLFQNHCYAELAKLKKEIKAKLHLKA